MRISKSAELRPSSKIIKEIEMKDHLNKKLPENDVLPIISNFVHETNVHCSLKKRKIKEVISLHQSFMNVSNALVY